jgi:hypothetical protein
MQSERERLQEQITDEDELDLTAYLNCMTQDKTWAENLSLTAMSAVTKRIIKIHQIELNLNGTAHGTFELQTVYPGGFGINVEHWQTINLLLTNPIGQRSHGHYRLLDIEESTEQIISITSTQQSPISTPIETQRYKKSYEIVDNFFGNYLPIFQTCLKYR